jgi:MYXO-CTERM domain-containing protein
MHRCSTLLPFHQEVLTMRRLALTCSVLGSLIAAGCAPAPGAGASDGPLEETKGAIAYGTSDGTKHTAVVALLADAGGGSFTECSGSIVQVKNGQAYVLTAAHCCKDGAPTIVVAGNDYSVGEQYIFGGNPQPPSYKVTAGSAYWDTLYNQYDHDFCMLKFAISGNVATLALPASCSSDGVANGAQLEHVGFGMTQNDNPTPGNPNPVGNSGRRTGTDSVSSFDSTTVSYNQGGGAQIPGTCEGDSGGPALIPAGVAQAQQKIVGVTSFGLQATCGVQDTGTSSRVCSEIGSGKFITNFLNDMPSGTLAGSTPPATCQTCEQTTLSQGGACASTYNACTSNTSCNTILTCQKNCGTDATCSQNCYTNNSAGQAKYDAIINCICGTGCPTECVAECGGSTSSSSSSGGSNCGLQAQDPTCNTCLTGNCCNQAAACSADPACVTCLGANPPASCNSNAALAGLYGCLQNSCAVPCGISSSSSSSSSSTSGISSSSSSSSSTSSSSGGSSTSSSTSSTSTSTSTSTTGGAGGAGGTGGDGTGGNNNQTSGCSLNVSGADPSSGTTIAGLLAAVALAFSRRRKSA